MMRQSNICSLIGSCRDERYGLVYIRSYDGFYSQGMCGGYRSHCSITHQPIFLFLEPYVLVKNESLWILVTGPLLPRVALAIC